MNIELYFQEDLKEGEIFCIPIDSEADEFMSGLYTYRIENGSLYIRTNCTGIKYDMTLKMLLIYYVMDEVYYTENGKSLSDPS